MGLLGRLFQEKFVLLALIAYLCICKRSQNVLLSSVYFWFHLQPQPSTFVNIFEVTIGHSRWHLFALISRKADESVYNPKITVHGRVYHEIGALKPPLGLKPRFAFIYIHDIEHTTKKRKHFYGQLRESILSRIAAVLEESNELVKSFVSLRDLMGEVRYLTVFSSSFIDGQKSFQSIREKTAFQKQLKWLLWFLANSTGSSTSFCVVTVASIVMDVETCNRFTWEIEFTILSATRYSLHTEAKNGTHCFAIPILKGSYWKYLPWSIIDDCCTNEQMNCTWLSARGDCSNGICKKFLLMWSAKDFQFFDKPNLSFAQAIIPVYVNYWQMLIWRKMMSKSGLRMKKEKTIWHPKSCLYFHMLI